MRATIKDVAKEAGVSPSTVTRVISNSYKISDKTKEKVNAAIKKLNYTPNVMARGLVNNKTNILGVLLPNEASNLFSNPFFVEAMRGMSICAEENGYYLMYAFTNTEKDEVNNIIDFTSSNLLDGICLLTVRENDRCIEYLEKAKFPFVVVGRPDNEEENLWVDNDNVAAMYDAVDRLIKSGKRDIAFIGANKEWKVSTNRLLGYKNALEDNGIEYRDDFVIMAKDFSEESGYLAMKELLAKTNVSAVVTTEDLIAIGANKFIAEERLEEIKIIGFNNIPIIEYQNPPISSIDINPSELGYQATKLLINKLNGRQDKNHYIVDTRFIAR